MHGGPRMWEGNRPPKEAWNSDGQKVEEGVEHISAREMMANASDTSILQKEGNFPQLLPKSRSQRSGLDCQGHPANSSDFQRVTRWEVKKATR